MRAILQVKNIDLRNANLISLQKEQNTVVVHRSKKRIKFLRNGSDYREIVNHASISHFLGNKKIRIISQ